MELKLSKTYLSRKPSSWSFLVGFIGLVVLALFFLADRNLLSANGYLVFEKKEYWRLFTSSLLHADLVHLAHNAFFFAGLSALLFQYFGFWVFPVLSLLVGALINLVAVYIYPPEVHLVGISGVIYFMASFWLTLYILIERRQKLLVRVVHAIAIPLIFLFPEVFDAQTSYLAHGLGFVFGVPLGLMYYFINKDEIRSKDVWVEIKRERDAMEDIILLEQNSFHLVTPEDHEPSGPASDSSRHRLH
jgi:rhomboid protease GluP